MRVLYISSAKTFGGGERHVVDLAREMTERGHEVFVALRPTNEWQSRLDFLPAERFLHVSIRNSFGMFSAKQIARFVERNNIDIIHAHVARDYIAASVAARSAKKDASRVDAARDVPDEVISPLCPPQRRRSNRGFGSGRNAA